MPRRCRHRHHLSGCGRSCPRSVGTAPAGIRPRWVDQLLFPDKWPSVDHLGPRLVRDLMPCDTVPNGRPCIVEFIVERAEAPRIPVLHSRFQALPGWGNILGAELEGVWTSAPAAHEPLWIAILWPGEFSERELSCNGIGRRDVSASCS